MAKRAPGSRRERRSGVTRGEGTRATPFEIGGDRFVLLSWPASERRPLPAGRVTPAEREVIELALEGLSNEEIARARGTSAGTVANQLASIYRKLAVGSRSGLSAWAGRVRARGTRSPSGRSRGS
jgi:DNA-binding CsgD family transcriptional regulator